MVNHNAAKFVTNIYPRKGNYENFSITKIMNYLNWNSIEKRREKARLNMAYKIIHGHVILDPNLMPKNKQQRPFRQCNNVNVGFENQLEEPQAKLKITSKTFFYSTPILWNNSVSPDQANAPSIDAFKNHFKNK